jgi:A/G-specific adenine glycosylase
LNPERFAQILLDWSSANQRELPWKKDNNPYIIWISEIILQQTRVEQGTPYFLRFVSKFPDIRALAAAEEDQVLKVWEGLGYYSRARNLHFTAKQICSKYGGEFPNTYAGILQLKGIGPYTAAAISSFAFELRHPVVDGNVLRFVARMLSILEPIDISLTKVRIGQFVTSAIQNVSPSSFNQAMMDFGSSICTPLKPKCDRCPFQMYCVSYQNDIVSKIPYKSKRIVRKDRYFHYLDITFPEELMLIVQRTNTDIWKNLYELPMIETDSPFVPDFGKIENYLQSIANTCQLVPGTFRHVYKDKQVLSHQNIYGFFYKIEADGQPVKINQDHYLVERAKVSNFAFPKIMTMYLKKVEI